MTDPESRPDTVRKGWLRRLPGRLLRGIKFLLLALVVTWASLALYFSPLPWAALRIGLAIAFATFGVWALWISRRPRMRWVFAGLYLVVLVGWSFIRPSHDREWRQDVAVMPRATIDGDRVRIRLRDGASSALVESPIDDTTRHVVMPLRL